MSGTAEGADAGAAQDYARMSMPELRAIKQELTDHETQVSYWRRLVQARIDLLEQGGGPLDVERISRLLADAPSAHRRISKLLLVEGDEVPPLPMLSGLWGRVPSTSEDTQEYVKDLREAEKQLSSYRRALFGAIDAVHAELIARYRVDPSLALDLLPPIRV